jgi:hypothetical protein
MPRPRANQHLPDDTSAPRHQLLDRHLDPYHATLPLKCGKEHEPEPKAWERKEKRKSDGAEEGSSESERSSIMGDGRSRRLPDTRTELTYRRAA